MIGLVQMKQYWQVGGSLSHEDIIFQILYEYWQKELL